MADDDTNESEYVRELNARHARFLALGGNIDLQTEMKGFTPLKDLVTDQHRKIVFDLCAAGLSNEAVAAVMGISKERLQKLFPTEINTAFELCMASISRSLYYMGIAGNEKAATNWAIYHNRSKWIKKQSVQGADDAPPIKHEIGAARETVNGLILGMMTAAQLKGGGKSKIDKVVAEVDTQKVLPSSKRKKAKPIKHVRKEDEKQELSSPVARSGRR